MKREIATHRERPGLSLWSLSFMSFAFWELARECTSTEGSFSPQWFLSFAYAVGCLFFLPFGGDRGAASSIVQIPDRGIQE